MSTTAKAYAALTSKAALVPHTVPRRAVGDEDVAFKILFCGVCHSDVHQARDEWGGSIFPMVPGHELVGRVTAVGSKVKKYKVGDTVGVGCMVDSCLKCKQCHRGEEQFCENGASFTYNSVEQDKKTPTYGGYSDHIVVRESFVVRIPSNLDLCGAAPLLCAGITTYSPLRHWGAKEGTRVGVVGLGGLGHMAVKLAKAMKCVVTVFTTSPSKVEAAKHLGADTVIISKDEQKMQACAKHFDLIIDTVGFQHSLEPYINALDINGHLVLVGVPEGTHPPFHPFGLISGRRSVCGSVIGGIKETQEMLDFCGKHNIVADVEKIDIQEINTAYERMLKSDVKYRFVIDLASLEK